MGAKNAKLYGVIDIGSNSIRLSVYTRSYGAYPLRKVFDEKQVVGLAAYVHNEHLAEEGVRAAAKAVKRQIEHARLLGCDNLRVFATAALRNCNNSKAATGLLEQMIAAPIDLISGRREAELGFAGMQPEVNIRQGYVADIGGASSEVSLVRAGKITCTTSLPIGSLSLWNGNVSGLMPTRNELARCRARVQAVLPAESFDSLAGSAASSLAGSLADSPANNESPVQSEEPRTLYGIGGTIRTVAKMWDGYTASHCSGNVQADSSEYVSREQVEQLIGFALGSPGECGHMVARLEPTRIHTATTGLVILSELLNWTGAERVRRSKHGIREGYVLGMK